MSKSGNDPGDPKVLNMHPESTREIGESQWDRGARSDKTSERVIDKEIRVIKRGVMFRIQGA